MDLPDILRHLRSQAGMTQADVAYELGVDHTTYGHYERGESMLRADQLKKIADLYNMGLDELYNYGSITVKEPSEPYKIKKNNISLFVELDGTPNTLQMWINRLTQINQMI